MRVHASVTTVLFVACLSAVPLMLTSNTFAADLTAPPPDQSTVDWTGLYVGAGASHGSFAGPVVSNDTSFDVLAGGNEQLGMFVLGAHGQISYAIDDLVGPVWVAGAGVRAGVLVMPNILAYGTLGLEHALIAGGSTYVTVGAGAEFMVASNVSLNLEATHGIQLGGPFTSNGLSAGLNWHF